MPPAEPGDKAQGKRSANEPSRACAVTKQTSRVEPSQGRCSLANQPPRLLEGFLCGNFTPGDQKLVARKFLATVLCPPRTAPALRPEIRRWGISAGLHQAQLGGSSGARSTESPRGYCRTPLPRMGGDGAVVSDARAAAQTPLRLGLVLPLGQRPYISTTRLTLNQTQKIGT